MFHLYVSYRYCCEVFILEGLRTICSVKYLFGGDFILARIFVDIFCPLENSGIEFGKTVKLIPIFHFYKLARIFEDLIFDNSFKSTLIFHSHQLENSMKWFSSQQIPIRYLYNNVFLKLYQMQDTLKQLKVNCTENLEISRAVPFIWCINNYC